MAFILIHSFIPISSHMTSFGHSKGYAWSSLRLGLEEAYGVSASLLSHPPPIFHKITLTQNSATQIHFFETNYFTSQGQITINYLFCNIL